MNIVGREVILRAIKREDLPTLNEWANDPEIQRLLGGWHFPTSMADQESWFATLSCQSIDQRFAVETDKLGLIGTANLVSVDWKNRTAFHGVMIGPRSAKGNGLGVDTIMAIERYAFDELGLRRLDSEIIEYNEVSLHTHVQKCGWEVEGRKQGWYYRSGRTWDKIIIGITEKQYREHLLKTRYWD